MRFAVVSAVSAAVLLLSSGCKGGAAAATVATVAEVISDATTTITLPPTASLTTTLPSSSSSGSGETEDSGLAVVAEEEAPAATGPTVTATSANFLSVLASAEPGSRIVLGAGNYGDVTIRNAQFASRVTVDASAATFSSIIFYSSKGVAIEGGTVSGKGRDNRGVRISGSSDIRIADMVVTQVQWGITLNDSSYVELVGNRLRDGLVDGIMVTSSQHVLIDGNSCRDFNYVPATYADDGTLIQDGDHPDCIQGFSRAGYSVVTDITIVNNDMEGMMQGIWFAQGTTEYNESQGGFERIVIRNNRVRAGFWNAIVLDSSRGGEVSGNNVSTLPGASFFIPPNQTLVVQAWLRVVNSPDVVACGNVVADFPTGFGTGAC